MRRMLDRLCLRLAPCAAALLLGGIPQVGAQTGAGDAGSDTLESIAQERGDTGGSESAAEGSDPGASQRPSQGDSGSAEAPEPPVNTGFDGEDDGDKVFAELESLTTGEPQAEGDSLDVGDGGDLTAVATETGPGEGGGQASQDRDDQPGDNPYPTDEDPYGEADKGTQDQQLSTGIDRTTVNGSIEAVEEAGEKTEEQVEAEQEDAAKKKAQELRDGKGKAAGPKASQDSSSKDQGKASGTKEGSTGAAPTEGAAGESEPDKSDESSSGESSQPAPVDAATAYQETQP